MAVGTLLTLQGCLRPLLESQEETDPETYIDIMNLEGAPLQADLVVRDESDERLHDATLEIDARNHGKTESFSGQARTVEYTIEETRRDAVTTETVDLPPDPGKLLTDDYEQKKILFHYTSQSGLEYVPIETETDAS
ncbi:hypothetical protein [Natrinema altunense]|uniref:Uncharacterized protein n=1 Tax=Natrinema altunense (strain JCM 12890 / CGMCC 1.3731 / AJ2) TaxID=1227494 RepID=L9ZT86_NATA2|nr:hypothetical protein [Natrinema altunense]ELY89675.1 hypothetical protein C485_04235 [Natrinema altunense JCM 12890]